MHHKATYGIEDSTYLLISSYFTKAHHYFVISQCMANTSEESHAVVGLYLHYHQEYLRVGNIV